MKTSYIGGQWRPGSDGYRNINPSDTSDVVDEFSQADESLALEAIDAAYQAFTTGQVLGVQARADALDRVGTELLARKEELGELLSREEGKPVRKVSVKWRAPARSSNFSRAKSFAYGVNTSNLSDPA